MTYAEAKAEIEANCTEKDAYRRPAKIADLCRAWAESQLAPVEDGYAREFISFDLNTGWVEYRDKSLAELDAEIAEARRASFVASGLIPIAAQLRADLRAITGLPDAEQNQAITEQYVFGYFWGRNVSGTMTDTERDRKDRMQAAFALLTEWTGNGTIWTVPWEVVQ